MGLTPFAQAMPDEYKRENPVEAYRTFYRENKQNHRGIVTYKKRPVPDFLKMDSCTSEIDRVGETNATLHPLP